MSQRLPSLLLILSLLFLGLAMTDCSWIEGYRARSAAKDQVEHDYETALTKEFDDTLGPGHARREDYVQFVIKHSHIEIVSLRLIRGNEYLATVKMHTVAAAARQVLLSIFKPLEGRTANSFNFTDAIGLIHQRQPDLEIEHDQTFDVPVHD